MIKIYTDAATKGNPGPTGLGILIIDQHHQQQLSQTIDQATNHCRLLRNHRSNYTWI